MLILSLLPLAAAQAEKRAILFGGNDDQDPSKNLFLGGMTVFSERLSSRSWTVKPLFDGETLGLNRAGLSKAAKTITPPPQATRKNLINELKQATNLRRGDQLLLSIATHGNLFGVGVPGTSTGLSYSDPELHVLLTKIRRRGVQIGFIIDSCYSGAAIPALKRYGCVLTSASDRVVAYGSYATSLNDTFGMNYSLARAMKWRQSEQITLEDGFVQALTDEARHCAGAACLQNLPQVSGFWFEDHNAIALNQLVHRAYPRRAPPQPECHRDHPSPISSDLLELASIFVDGLTQENRKRLSDSLALPLVNLDANEQVFDQTHLAKLADLQREERELSPLKEGLIKRLSSIPVPYAWTLPKELWSAETQIAKAMNGIPGPRDDDAFEIKDHKLVWKDTLLNSATHEINKSARYNIDRTAEETANSRAYTTRALEAQKLLTSEQIRLLVESTVGVKPISLSDPDQISNAVKRWEPVYIRSDKLQHEIRDEALLVGSRQRLMRAKLFLEGRQHQKTLRKGMAGYEDAQVAAQCEDIKL